MARSLGVLITERLTAMGRTQADLRSELKRVGVELTRQSIHNWTINATSPEAGHMLALFKVFIIPVDEQPEWWEAKARPDDAPAEVVP